MRNTARRRDRWRGWLIWIVGPLAPLAASAEVHVTTQGWEPAPPCPGVPPSFTVKEVNEMHQGIRPWPDCPRSEARKVNEAAERAAALRNAAPPGDRGKADRDLGYKLYIDEKKYYLQPMLFMAKQHPGDVCTPAPFANAPTYQCVEGQRYRVGCHVFIFDESFKEVGFHTIEIKESALYFCNAVPAVGVGDKTRNEVLMTVQYFFIDGTPAAQISEIGSGWKRMTVALRLKAEGGKVLIEQDDRCLGNPNRIETVPDARRRLARCAR